MMCLKHVIFLILTFLFLHELKAQDKLIFEKIKENIYQYTTFNEYNGIKFPSNGLYLVDSKGIIIFDTPWDTTQFQPFLDSLEKRHNKRPIISISTHFHDDRTAGLDFFVKNNIKTFTSLHTKKLCIEQNEKQAEFTFSKDTVFQFDDFSIETFYPGEGHSPDNIVLYIQNFDILYGGCFIKSIENDHLGNIADANIKEWRNSVLKVIKKYPNTKFVIPGHYKNSDSKALTHTLNLIKNHEKKKNN